MSRPLRGGKPTDGLPLPLLATLIPPKPVTMGRINAGAQGSLPISAALESTRLTLAEAASLAGTLQLLDLFAKYSPIPHRFFGLPF